MTPRRAAVGARGAQVPTGGSGPIAKTMHEGCVKLMEAAQMTDESQVWTKSQVTIVDNTTDIASVGWG